MKISFDKKLFKQEVLNNLKTQFRVELNNASQQQIYQAVAYALKEWIIEDWMDTQKTYEEKDPKILYYMSMEFLMGRALGNNLINMSMYGEVKEALDELGVDLLFEHSVLIADSTSIGCISKCCQ